MRIAYYLNDGTRKIGDAEEFQRDYDANAVAANRQASVEIKTEADLQTFAQASVLTSRLKSERKAVAVDAALDFIRRSAPKAALALFAAGVGAEMVKDKFFPAGLSKEANDVYLECSTLFAVGVFLAVPLIWLIAKSALNLRRSRRACEFDFATEKARAAAIKKWQEKTGAAR